MNQTRDILRSNWLKVTAEVAEACQAAGRTPEEVKIVGVSKYVGPELTELLASVGCHELGENRPQQLWEKCDWLAAQPQPPIVHWHMIGHLQRNKVKRTLPLISWLHSVDSLRLATAVSQEASAAGLTVRALSKRSNCQG